MAKALFFTTVVPMPSSPRRRVLRMFGARIGTGVVIRSRVNIHMPWKLSVGDHVWIGDDVLILNLEPVAIGSNACISQRAFLCTGNHDYKSPTFDYFGQSIEVGEGAWVGAQSFVGPGVSIGVDAVVTAGSVVLADLPDRQVCSGNPCVPVRDRVFRDAADGVVEG